MRLSIKVALVGLLSAWFTSATLAEELSEKVLSDLAPSILLLSSASESVCGTGVLFSNGQIITAAHLAKDLCTGGSCDSLSIERQAPLNRGDKSKGIKSPGKSRTKQSELITGLQYRVSITLPGLDLALLSPKDKVQVHGTFEIDHLSDYSDQESLAGKQVFSLAFPKCQKLAVNAGTISHSDPISFFTTVQGNYGSSGGALIDTHGNLMGLITEAGSLSETLKAQLLNSDFSVRAHRISPKIITADNLEASLLAEAELISQFYRRRVLSERNTSERKWRDLEFDRLMKGFKDRIISVADDLNQFKPLLVSGGYPIDVVNQLVNRSAAPTKLLYRLADELALYHSIENRGLRKSFSHELDAASLTDLLKWYGYRNLTHVVKRASKDKYPGSYAMWLAFGVSLTLLSGLFMVVYVFSLGYVWGKDPSGFVKRLVVTLLVAVLVWPISLIGFHYRLRRLKKRKLSS